MDVLVEWLDGSTHTEFANVEVVNVEDSGALTLSGEDRSFLYVVAPGAWKMASRL